MHRHRLSSAPTPSNSGRHQPRACIKCLRQNEMGAVYILNSLAGTGRKGPRRSPPRLNFSACFNSLPPPHGVIYPLSAEWDPLNGIPPIAWRLCGRRTCILCDRATVQPTSRHEKEDESRTCERATWRVSVLHDDFPTLLVLYAHTQDMSSAEGSGETDRHRAHGQGRRRKGERLECRGR